MSLKPFFRLYREGRLTPLLSVGAGLRSFYKLTYLAAAGESGLLTQLAAGPATLDSLAGFFSACGQGREALEAWLQMGIRLRLLSFGPRGYALRGLALALARNPSLTALGLELQPAVAEMARRNLSSWGLQDRVRIEGGDFRAKPAGELFDIATLYNNIYYFPVDERLALLQRIATFLKPGGFLLLTTCCQGGSLGTEALNLWGAATSGAGRLPSEQELVAQLRQAGYSTVKTRNLLPGDRFLAFQAFRS